MIPHNNSPPVCLLLATLAAASAPFVAATIADSQPAQPTRLSVVEGVVTYKGRLPDPIPLPEANGVRPVLEVSPRNHGLKDVVVWLAGAPAPRKLSSADRRTPAKIDQRDYFFVPHVLAIESGQQVEFSNSDAPNHGVMATAFDARNSFNVVTPPGGRYQHRFVASKRPVKIGCPIHAGMAAWIYVFDHPYYAVSDTDGRFRLPGVPPGSYTLTVEHPDAAMRRTRQIELATGAQVSLPVEFSEKDLRPNR